MISTSYDPEADAMYVRMVPPGTKVAETREIEPGVLLDYAADGRLVGVEILNVRARSAAKPVAA